MSGLRTRSHTSPPAPAGTPAASNAFSAVALVLGLAPFVLLPLYVGLVGLLVGLGALRRHENLASTAVTVCVVGLGVGSMMSLFLHDVLSALLYQR